jgi:hypothetical protein
MGEAEAGNVEVSWGKDSSLGELLPLAGGEGEFNFRSEEA